MLSAQGVDRVCMDVERNESQEAHKSKRIPTSVLPSSEGVDGYNILEHSQCRLWCPCCVVRR